jgi:hypothetical protein
VNAHDFGGDTDLGFDLAALQAVEPMDGLVQALVSLG